MRWSRRPRIGLELHFLDDKVQGIRTHCVELFSRIVKSTPEIDFYCMLADTSLLAREGFTSPNVIPVPIRKASRLARYGFSIGSLARQHQLDLLHCQVSTPPFVPCSSVITIHDILPQTHPEYFSSNSRILTRLSQVLAIRRAKHIYTVSEYSKAQIARVYNFLPSKITILLNGVNTDRFTPRTVQGHIEIGPRGLEPGSYILTVGRLEPRKNHKRLFQAFAMLPPDRPPLVVVGQRDFGYAGIFETLNALGIQNEVHLLEDVNDEELPLIYRNAKMFIYPSLAEGFGMPILEAMASGVPVITADNTALVEAAGKAAILVDASDVGSLTREINKLMGDEDLCQEMIALGYQHVDRFNWNRFADVLRTSYFSLLDEAMPPT